MEVYKTMKCGRYDHKEPTGQKKPVASQAGPLHSIVKVPAFLIDKFSSRTASRTKRSPVMPAAKRRGPLPRRRASPWASDSARKKSGRRPVRDPNTIYSYSDVYDQEMCGNGVEEIHHLGTETTEACISGYGVADMGGNHRGGRSARHRVDRSVVKGGWRNNNSAAPRARTGTDERQNFSDSARLPVLLVGHRGGGCPR